MRSVFFEKGVVSTLLKDVSINNYLLEHKTYFLSIFNLNEIELIIALNIVGVMSLQKSTKH